MSKLLLIVLQLLAAFAGGVVVTATTNQAVVIGLFLCVFVMLLWVSWLVKDHELDKARKEAADWKEGYKKLERLLFPPTLEFAAKAAEIGRELNN